MNNIIGVALGGLMVIGILLLVGLLIAFPIVWIWNAVVVAIFGLPAISWGQALGLYVLSGLLFKNTSATNN